MIEINTDRAILQDESGDEDPASDPYLRWENHPEAGPQTHPEDQPPVTMEVAFLDHLGNSHICLSQSSVNNQDGHAVIHLLYEACRVYYLTLGFILLSVHLQVGTRRIELT